MDKIKVGVDEVNYSPSLAGPCIVCALWYPPDVPKVRGVKDSKQLTHKQRIRLFERIQQRGALFAVVPATVQAINMLGVHQARAIAAQTAVYEVDLLLRAHIGRPADRILVDGPTRILDDPRAEFIKDGDARVYEIAAASIMAKVYVDMLFEGYEAFWPGYGVNRDHGAVSKKHKQRLREHGPAPFHRIGGKYAPEWYRKIVHNVV